MGWVNQKAHPKQKNKLCTFLKPSQPTIIGDNGVIFSNFLFSKCLYNSW
jgi:hypothetical protein